MDIALLSQPYRESRFSGEAFIAAALADEGVTSLLVITAWLRESGVSLLVPGLQAVRERGGSSKLIFGVDLRGTTRQGVELARQQFAEVSVVHDPDGRTFHPKAYLAVGQDIGYALIGSSNLTAGGLWHNYEAGITAIFDPRREGELAAEIEVYASALQSDDAICKKVTDEVFGRLVDEGWLGDERHRRRQNEDHPSGSRRPRDPGQPSLFSASAVQKRDRPAPVRRARATTLSRRRRRRLATAPDCWWKPLGAGDAQHPETGNPTGNVALTHVPSDFDRIGFFRDTFFGAETWRSTNEGGRRSEVATITAEVDIEGERRGTYEFEIVYRRYRMRRGRATTVLRWGRLLPELHARDLSGWFLLIERGGSDMYRLQLVEAEPR